LILQLFVVDDYLGNYFAWIIDWVLMPNLLIKFVGNEMSRNKYSNIISITSKKRFEIKYDNIVNYSIVKNKKIIAIIPTYNEELSIKKTCTDLIKHHPNIDILVVNDSSTDNTAKIVESMSSVKLITSPINLGIGGAVQLGLKFAYKNNYDVAFQFDGDGQHRANEFDKLLNRLEDDASDIAIGSRFMFNDKTNFRSSFLRRLGINFFAMLITFLIRKKITDPTSGFRAFNKKAIAVFSKNYPFDFPEPEVIIIAKKKKLNISEVFVKMNEREFGVSSISPLKSVKYMFKVTMAILLAFFRENV